MNDTIIKRLNVAIIMSGKTTRQIISESGISKSNYYNIRNGTIDNITTGTIRKLCRTLDVSADWLLGLTNEHDPK